MPKKEEEESIEKLLDDVNRAFHQQQQSRDPTDAVAYQLSSIRLSSKISQLRDEELRG